MRAKMFSQSGVQPGQQALHAEELAYALYRRALIYLSDRDESRAIEDLETARKFSGLSSTLRSLIQQRLSIIQKAHDVEVMKFDDAIADRFDSLSSDVKLRGEFLSRFRLSQAKRGRIVAGIDEISSVGVYRWAGDTNRNEQWSRLIREFKKGDALLPAFFGAHPLRTRTGDSDVPGMDS